MAESIKKLVNKQSFPRRRKSTRKSIIAMRSESVCFLLPGELPDINDTVPTVYPKYPIIDKISDILKVSYRKTCNPLSIYW
jgi:hypothetical protein